MIHEALEWCIVRPNPVLNKLVYIRAMNSIEMA